jgi:AbrB family looped-hinge helix DNA binding protein
MTIAVSKLTAKGQISVPANVRRKLKLRTGSKVEWIEENGHFAIRPVGRFTSEDIHRVLFPNGPPKPLSVEEMDECIREYMREKHALD